MAVKKNCCFYVALWSREAAVGGEIGSSKMDFSPYEYWCKVMSLERCPCSFILMADVKAWYLSLMYEMAETSLTCLKWLNAMSRCPRLRKKKRHTRPTEAKMDKTDESSLAI